jgi:agmatinase
MGYRDLYLSNAPLLTTKKEGRRIVLFGVPFDGTSSFRPGARFGPPAFRNTYWMIELYDPILDKDAEEVPMEDLGDLNPSNDVEEMVKAVEKVAREVLGEGNVPAAIGGEHTLTMGMGRALEEDVALMVFDAHLDMRDELYGHRLSHGTFLRRLLEERRFEFVLHVGGRAAAKEEWVKAGKRAKVIDGFMEQDKRLVKVEEAIKGFDRFYVSLDLDVLDPAYAPGVGNPEPGGLSSKELFEILYLLKGKRLVGFDVTELCPPFDSGVTSSVAAKAFSILSLLTGV